jgi:hypothetical protein
VAGQPIGHPVEAFVSDAFGNAVAGTLVTVTAKSGKVTPARARADSAGRVAVRWVLGSAAGEQRIEAGVKDGGQRATGTVRATTAAHRKR